MIVCRGGQGKDKKVPVVPSLEYRPEAECQNLITFRLKAVLRAQKPGHYPASETSSKKLKAGQNDFAQPKSTRIGETDVSGYLFGCMPIEA